VNRTFLGRENPDRGQGIGFGSDSGPGLLTLLWLLFGAASALLSVDALTRLFYVAALSTLLRAASAAFTDATGAVRGPASAGFTCLFLLVGATCTGLTPTS
jgi:hypothetical protein